MKISLLFILRNNIFSQVFVIAFFFVFITCQFSCKSDVHRNNSGQEAIQKPVDNSGNKTVLNDTLGPSKTASENFNLAKEAYLKSNDDPTALIWYGRRTAYLGKYQEAIAIFTEGIKKHPKDARIYRHRGHRYISVREYDKAIRDLEFAAGLIAGQQDLVEPDGLINSRNLPLSTLHGNIYYHLGLAYYLKNDMENALRAFSNRTVTEKYDDNIVSGGHWLYMILRRMGRISEANAAIEKVVPNMDIIENMSYYKMCLFYKGLIPTEDLVLENANSSANDVLNYGLGNWYLYHKKDTVTAKKYYQELLKNGNTFSFAYIACESDWNRLFKN